MITLKKLLERAKSELIAIHTPTEKQAKALLKALDEKGYVWLTETKLTTETWYEYEENICYDFYDDVGKLLDKKVMYCSLGWYQEEGYTIIEFSEIDFAEKLYKEKK